MYLEVLDCSLGSDDPCRKDGEGNYLWEFVNQSKFFHFNSGLAYGIVMNFIVFIWTKNLSTNYPISYGFLSIMIVIFVGVAFSYARVLVHYMRYNVDRKKYNFFKLTSLDWILRLLLYF